MYIYISELAPAIELDSLLYRSRFDLEQDVNNNIQLNLHTQINTLKHAYITYIYIYLYTYIYMYVYIYIHINK